MKVLAINSTDSGSTGNIAIKILQAAKDRGFEVCLACVEPKTNKVPTFNISCGKINRFGNHIYSRLFGRDGFSSNKNTKRLIKFISFFKPDILHLHNLHDYYLNIEKLFKFLSNTNINVVWTFHDCWAFTGKCPNFLHNQCFKWKTECVKCPAKHEYPNSLIFNNTKKLFKKKINIFEMVPVHIVCPSQWMLSNVRQSKIKFLSNSVIYNGIDQSFFNEANVKNENSDILIFSMAYPWTPYKGLNTILKVAEKLKNEKDIRFLIGGLDKKTVDFKNVTCVGKMTRREIIKTLDASTVFLNPSEEESFGLTNIEAQSRGVPVVICGDAGGAEETVINKKTGIVVKKNDITDMINAIQFIRTNIKIMSKAARDHALLFSELLMVDNYINLYKRLINENEEK